jgi:uncharacterized repeat protein (TIGR01451 family)
MSKLRIVIALFLIPLLLIGILNVPRVSAAPSGTVEVEEDNVLQLGDSTEVVVTFRNTATTALDDVASTIQYITLAAADLNPSRALIALNASWEIYKPGDSTPRVSGNVTGSLDTGAIYAPYSTTGTIYLYTWALGQPSTSLIGYTDASQFTADPTLKVLRPGEFLKLTVTVECQNVVGDSRLWFFFRATEAAYSTGSYPTNISALDTADRKNLYYSKLPGPGTTKYWLPLHNSYDLYDSGIGTGHVFEQHSWEIEGTIRAFAKSNKLVHQKPGEDPELACIDVIKRGPAMAQAGDNITYEFTVANCGDVDLSDVTVTDPLLSLNKNIGGLAVGANYTFTVPYTISDPPPSDPLENTATASGKYDDKEVTDQDSHSVDIVEEGDPCIDIIKEGPAVARIGDTIIYEFTVTNCGAVNLTGVNVTDPLLSLTKNIGALAVGTNHTFTAPYTIPEPPPSDPLSNNATASGRYNDEEVTDWDSHSVNIDRCTFSFHICGIKFDDLNRNGRYDVGIEAGINEVTVILLGADRQSKAEIYYPGDFAYPPPEANPLESGENQLRGSYCFNLENVDPEGGVDNQGTYKFYVKIEEPPDKMATTPMLIGPITLRASCAGPRESLNHHFGNAIPPAVGGEAYPADKLAILAPWLALAAALIAGSIVVIKKRWAQS